MATNRNSEVALFRVLQTYYTQINGFTYDNDDRVVYVDSDGVYVDVSARLEEAITEVNNQLSDCEKCSSNLLTMSTVFGKFFTSQTSIPVIWQLPNEEQITADIPSYPMLYKHMYLVLAMNGTVTNWRGEFVQNRTYQVGDGVMCDGKCYVSIEMNNSSEDIVLEDNKWVSCDDCCCINEY